MGRTTLLELNGFHVEKYVPKQMRAEVNVLYARGVTDSTIQEVEASEV